MAKEYIELECVSYKSNKPKKVKINQINHSQMYDIIDATVRESYVGFIYHPLLVSILGDLNIVYCCVNWEFTPEEKQNPLELYDKLKKCGLIDLVVSNVTAYNSTHSMIGLTIEKIEHNQGSIAKALEIISEQFIPNAKEAVSIMENFDQDKFKQITQLAQAVK